MYIQFPVLRGQSLITLLSNSRDPKLPHHYVHLNCVIASYLLKLLIQMPTSEIRPFVINRRNTSGRVCP